MTWPHAVEVLSRHAGRCLEALTARKAARALAERPQVPGRWFREATKNRCPPADTARLLTPEIKMYHELDVVAGRRERDLATRLGGELRAPVRVRAACPPTSGRASITSRPSSCGRSPTAMRASWNCRMAGWQDCRN